MQGRKKYLVNMLSYKYKQESMKLFPSILSKNIIPNPSKDIIENPLRNVSNLCPGGKNCQNYIIICQLEKQIKTLNETIIQLKQINEFDDRKVNKMPFSELKINDSFKSEKSDKNSELCNSFRNSSVKRSNSLFDDKQNKQMHQTASCTLRTLSNDSEDKSKDEFNYIRNRIKCFTLHKELNTNTDNILSESCKPKEPKVNAYKIFQSNFMKKKSLNQRLEQSDRVEEKLNREAIKNKVIFRNNMDDNSCEKNKKENNSFSNAIKILHNNVVGMNNNSNKEIKIGKNNENDKNCNGKKIKINLFSGIKPVKSLKTSNKYNLNLNLNLSSDNELQSKQKIAQNPDKLKNMSSVCSKDNNNSKKNTQNNNKLLLNEFNNYIKDYEVKSNYINGELIYNNLYSLTLQKDKKLLENFKSLSDENIYKYSSLINYSLKYISNITSFVHKVKYIFNNNFNNDNSNVLNIQNPYYSFLNCNNLNDDFNKFKDVCKNSLNCEKVNIYLYDINTDCLILKEENNEKIYPKDKDLIGLSFTSCKKIRHEPDSYKSKVFSTMALEQRLKIKIHNLLVFPLKDKEGNVHGVIEAINKLKEDKSTKAFFSKDDEIL